MQTGMNVRAQQQARWLLWQMGGVSVDGGGAIGAAEPTAPKEPPQDFRRPRYDAVIRRMQQAGQRTGTYTPWTQPTIVQPASGSP